MNKIILYCTVYLALIFFSSCNFNNKKVEKDSISRIIIDMPERKQDSFSVTRTNEIYQLSKIEDLKKGVKGFVLRITFFDQQSNENMLQFTKQHNHWTTSLSQLNYIWDSQGNLDTVITRERAFKQLIKTDDLIDSLVNFGIFSLPDISTIPGAYEIAYDQRFIVFEVADSEMYRYFAYDLPLSISQPIAKKEKEKVLAICRFLKKKIEGLNILY